MLCAEVGSKKPWRKEKIAFQNSPLSTYNWSLCARSRRSEYKWTPIYREDTRLQGGHPSTRRTPVYREDTFRERKTPVYKKDTRLQGGHPSTRKTPTLCPIYKKDPRLQGGHASTGGTPVYKEDTRLQGGHPSTRRTPTTPGPSQDTTKKLPRSMFHPTPFRK